MVHRHCLIAALVLACGGAAASQAQAAQVDLTGDYGTATWGNNLTPVPIGFGPGTVTTIPPFGVPGFGSLNGIVEAQNFGGTSLMLRVTQLNFIVTSPINGAFTDLTLDVIRDFTLAGPGNYTVSHSLTGTWPTSTQNAVSLSTNVIHLDGTAQNVPTIGGPNTGGTTVFNFNSGPINGTAPLNTVSLHLTLNLRLNNTGTINLPTSADVYLELVPAPGAAALLGFGAIVAARRRR